MQPTLHGHIVPTIVATAEWGVAGDRVLKRPTFSDINRKLSGLIEQSDSHNYISMLELCEVPTDSVDSLEKEGTEENAAVREEVDTLSASC